MDNADIARSIESLRTNEELTVQVTRRKKASTPPYSTIGNGFTTREYENAPVVDAFRVIGQLSPQQLEIFLHFRNMIVDSALYHRNTRTINQQPNHVILSRSSTIPKDQEIRKLLGQNHNCTKLEELGVIKKIKPGVYMVNPFLLIPANNFNNIAKEWLEI